MVPNSVASCNPIDGSLNCVIRMEEVNNRQKPLPTAIQSNTLHWFNSRLASAEKKQGSRNGSHRHQEHFQP